MCPKRPEDALDARLKKGRRAGEPDEKAPSSSVGASRPKKDGEGARRGKKSKGKPRKSPKAEANSKNSSSLGLTKEQLVEEIRDQLLEPQVLLLSLVILPMLTCTLFKRLQPAAIPMAQT